MVKKARCFRVDADILSLEGIVTFYTAKELCEELIGHIPSSKNITVQLQKITHCDSAIFVVLLALHRLAATENKKMIFSGASEEMYSLANLYNLTTILTELA